MSESYAGRSDLELIVLYRSGSQDACTALLARYANLINHQVSAVRIVDIDRDDIRQEAYMGLFSAVRTYDPARGASFHSYATVCIGNSIKNLFASASTQKARLYSQALSIDDIEEISFRGKADANPETILIDREACEELQRLIHRVLSEFEREVLFSYLSGRGYTEVAAKLHSSQKSVDNALQRARKKLKAVLNSL